MHWIAPSEKDTATDTLEKRLWDSADQFRANSGLKQNLSLVFASKMEFALPPRAVREPFASVAESMARRIVQLYSTIQNLRRTRDLLLPRLLSGQVALRVPTGLS